MCFGISWQVDQGCGSVPRVERDPLSGVLVKSVQHALSHCVCARLVHS